MAGTPTPNSSARAFWVNQAVSPWKKTVTLTAPSWAL